MRFFIDEENFFLSKVLDNNALSKYTTSWAFYNRNEELNIGDFFDTDKKIFSFLWEYSDDTCLQKVDKWKRAFRRNKVEIPLDIKQYQKDFFLSERKIYLDFIAADFSTTNQLFGNMSKGKFTQIIVGKEVGISDFNLKFLDEKNTLNRFRKYIDILEHEGIYAIVINGYHHAGENIKVFVHKREIDIMQNGTVLPWNIFENTYVKRSFNW